MTFLRGPTWEPQESAHTPTHSSVFGHRAWFSSSTSPIPFRAQGPSPPPSPSPALTQPRHPRPLCPSAAVHSNSHNYTPAQSSPLSSRPREPLHAWQVPPRCLKCRRISKRKARLRPFQTHTSPPTGASRVSDGHRHARRPRRLTHRPRQLYLHTSPQGPRSLLSISTRVTMGPHSCSTIAF